MLAFGVSLVAVAAFCWTLVASGIVGVARGALDRAAAGSGAMLDARLSDDAKEAAVRAAGLDLLRAAWGLLWRTALCLAAAALPVLAFAAAGLVGADEVGALMLRWDYIAAVSFALMAAAWFFPRSAGNPAAPAYPAHERLVHQLAFAGPAVQRRAAALDDRLFARTIRAMPDRPPVFITSLPRAGTTALLNAVATLPGAATHRYRDMPFVTAPLLWDRAGRLTGRRVERRARAHGDGLEIDLDSPEAFEEVLWRLFWPAKFGEERIALWTAADNDPEAAAFFRRHFRKIVALRTGGRGRYVSKNNGNIARLDLLPAMFPGCAIVVPLRRPAAHAASLLRQHRNFARLQAGDPFVERYMGDIGHLEFGRLHRPVAFPDFEPGGRGPDEPDYWLACWIAAFRAVLDRAGGLVLVEQDALRRAPQAVLSALSARLGMDAGGLDFARHFRSSPDAADASVFDPARLAEADALYEDLAARALRP